MTTKLAELLRRIAEKEPEKFEISLMGTVFALAADDSLPGFYIRHHDRLNEQENFTLDHMDAIAGALGMEFEVRRIQRHCWAIEVFDDVTPISGDLDDSKHPTKRSASIAALCAILEHRYGPTTGETK